jgi:hypothetical protein
MNCRRIIRCCLTTVVGVAVLQPPTFAQSTTSECQAPLYQTFYYQEKIPALTASDIMGGLEGNDGLAEQVSSEAELLAGAPPFKLSITRNLQQFWRMRVQSTDVPFLKAKYKVVNTNPTGNPFNKVDVTQLGNIDSVASCSDGSAIVQGGVTFVFGNISGMTSGTHTGQLQMCVVTEKSSCP